MKPPPDVEFTAALATADRAMQAVLGDAEAWAAEAAREAADPVPWPLQALGEGYPQLLRILAATAVESVLQAIEQQHGHAVLADAADAEFQTVLRVVMRAVDAADTALRLLYGGIRGTYRLTGKREFHNWLKKREVEAALMSGHPRAEALTGLSISRAAAYRAMRRR